MVYSNILESLILPTGDVLLGTSFIQQLKKCRNHDSLSEAELNQLQHFKLNEMLNYVLKHSPYYRDLGIKHCENDPISTLKQFPILTKSIIKEHSNEILTTSSKKLIKLMSSGSSGIQGEVFLSKREISVTRAQQTRWWEWAGYKLGDKLLQTGMAEKRTWVKRIKDLLLKTTYVHAFALSEQEIFNILNQASNKSIRHFYGYASSLYVFSEVAHKNNIKVSFDSIVSWGDKMFQHYRKNISTAFKSEVLETYGCSEGFMIAAQYDLPYLYIMTPWVFLELLDNDGNEVKDGEIGNVVVTSLFAKSFPLIRYKLGDLAIRLAKEKYPKSRRLNYPLLEKVIGRDTDIVRTKSGKSMIVHSFTGIFEYYPEIKQFQVVQNRLDEITIYIIPEGSALPNSIHEIKKKIQKNIGDTIKITFRKTNEIPPSPSGKPQIIKSTI